MNPSVPGPTDADLRYIAEIRAAADAGVAALEAENRGWYTRMANICAAAAADVLHVVFPDAATAVVAIYDNTVDIVAVLAEDGTILWYTTLVFTRSQVAEDHALAFDTVAGYLQQLNGNPAIDDVLELAYGKLTKEAASKIGIFGDLHRILDLRPGAYDQN
jgi:hypothetical protein